MMGELKGLMTKLDAIASLEHKILSLENELKTVRREVWNKVQDSENAVKNHVSDRHADLHEHVKENVKGGHTRLILFIVGGQLVSLGGFVLYKRRRAGPKKYL